MKEAFVEKKFHAESLQMISRINTILDNYEAQGYDLSLRQLYYQLVSQNLVPNTEKSYKNVGNLVSDARLAGLIDWNMIRDRGRNTSHGAHCESIGEALGAAVYTLNVDMWARQSAYCEVFVEKQALEGVLEPVCTELDIPFTANKGYSSSSAMYDASKRYLRAAEAGKELHILYLGDHDPSGIDMSRDVDDRFLLFIATVLDGYGRPFTPDKLGSMDHPHQLHRLALNMDQVDRYHPPENPAKLTDTRAEDYVRRFGRSSWELDALEPSILADLVKTAVRKLIDPDIWEEDLERQRAGRAELQRIADEYTRGRVEDFTREERPHDE